MFDAISLVDGTAVVKQNCTACLACADVCPCAAIAAVSPSAVKITGLDRYRGVWIFAEQRAMEIQKVTLELLGEGRKIADTLQTELTAVLLGPPGIETRAADLIRHAADQVLVVEHELLTLYSTDAYAQVWYDLVQERAPEIILIGATTIGRDLGPRLAARCRTGLTADCTSLEADLPNRRLLQTRPAFGGNLMATIICPDHRPQMATIRPGVMAAAPCDPRRQGRIEQVAVVPAQAHMRALVKAVVQCARPETPLEEAAVIVAGGRGVGGKKGFELLQALADCLGGVIAASRAAIDAMWISEDRQIGLTGKTVRPDLYIACGISGASQHVSGMKDARCIVAIDVNPDAPIFEVAHYGIVGDLFDVIPEIIRELEQKVI
jgi:electron transfer flavoprotein alpha subunit